MAKYVRVGQAMATLTMELEKESEQTKEDSDSDETTDEKDSDSTKNSSDEDANGENDSTTDDKDDSTQETDNEDQTGTDQETVSASDGSTFYVSIDAPEGVEVYVDGNYVGLSPARCKKTAGSHVIILRKSGYQTRSYTIDLDDEKKDVAYSFSELIPLSE